MNWDYVAGFFDGEGSITCYDARGRMYSGASDHVRISIGQKYPSENVLYEIQTFLISEGLTNPRVWRDKNRQMEYLLITNKTDAAKFLGVMLQYTIRKKKAILEGLKHLGNIIDSCPHLTENKKAYVRDSRKHGITIAQMAKHLGCSKSTCYRVLKKRKPSTRDATGDEVEQFLRQLRQDSTKAPLRKPE